MSLILKSNNVAENHLGSLKSVLYTAQKAYDEYAARVATDGGSVRDAATTLAMFDQLIKLGVFGLARTFIFGGGGVKVDTSGNIIKVYALDGEDLEILNLSGGASPIIRSVGGGITFTNVVGSKTTGSILVSPKIKAKGRGLVVGFKIDPAIMHSVSTMLSGFTLLHEKNNATPLWSVAKGSNTTMITTLRQIGETPNQNNSSSTQNAKAQLEAKTGGQYLFFADVKNKKFLGYRAGVLTTLPDVSPQFSDISEFSGYINLGGAFYWSGPDKHINLYSGVIYNYFMYDDLPQSAVEKLAKI